MLAEDWLPNLESHGYCRVWSVRPEPSTLLLSARVVQADEAERIGLVNAVYPPSELLNKAVNYASDLAQNCSPASMAAIKRQVYEDVDRGIDEASTRALEEMVESFRRPDVKEGAASFLERRKPEFEPLPPDRQG